MISLSPLERCEVEVSHAVAFPTGIVELGVNGPVPAEWSEHIFNPARSDWTAAQH